MDREDIDYLGAQMIGLDTSVNSLEKRIKSTPLNDVRWENIMGGEGRRGQSRCFPTDKESRELLEKFGREYVVYNIKGEPDFAPFEEVSVRISDMSDVREKNFSSTKLKLLDTEWAKEKGFKTQADITNYMKEHKLTLHECGDGVTVRLVPEKINERFKHLGGVSEIKAMGEKINLKDSNILRVVGKGVGTANIKKNKAIIKGEETLQQIADTCSEKIDETVDKFMSDEMKAINQAGMDAATNAAIFAGTLSIVRNALQVAQGNKEKEDALKDVVVDSASSATMAYITGVVEEGISVDLGDGTVSMMVYGTVQISKQIIRYSNGEITEEQLANNIAEEGAYLVAAYIGKNVGEFVGGGIGMVIGNALFSGIGGKIGYQVGREIGKIVGEMITTMVCSEVISTIKFSKDFEKKNNKIISLYKNAEREISISKVRLMNIINVENEALRESINEGYEVIYAGIEQDSYELIRKGIACIGTRFGMTQNDFMKNDITRENLFQSEEIIVFE